MNKKYKIVKIIIVILLILFPIGLIIGLFVDWNFPGWIYISGSSTMQPLIKEISKLYNNAEIIVDGTGSSTGIINLINNQKDIASVSKSPSIEMVGLPNHQSEIEQPGKYKKEWINDEYKTLTIAWDGIGIVYKEINKNIDIDFDINQTNIIKLYEVFGNQNNVQYFINSNNQINQSNTNQIDSSNNNLKIIPFARLGGANASGTAEAFLESSNFDLTTLDPIIKENLLSGNYNKNVIKTDDSNLLTWNKIKNEKIYDNQFFITYLSAGFIFNNYKEIIDNGFKIATYNNNQLIQNNNLNFPENYKWYRPFNLIFALKNIETSIKQFISWVEQELYPNNQLNNNSKLAKLIIDMGYKPLLSNEWNSMEIDNNIFVSDYTLLANDNNRWISKKFYGAY